MHFPLTVRHIAHFFDVCFFPGEKKFKQKYEHLRNFYFLRRIKNFPQFWPVIQPCDRPQNWSQPVSRGGGDQNPPCRGGSDLDAPPQVSHTSLPDPPPGFGSKPWWELLLTPSHQPMDCCFATPPHRRTQGPQQWSEPPYRGCWAASLK